jgi:NAD(P)-dependent dehydrogenase (short-subunit alcohol dehydrogenase family)
VLPDTVASSTAKAALLAFMRNMAVKVGPYNITANAIVPAMVMTEGNAYMPHAALEAITARTPLGHIATPEEIAGVVAFLAGEDSRFVTGTCLTVDGGISLHA